MKKNGLRFTAVLIISVLLIVASLGLSVAGAISERSALSVLGELALDVFMSGDSYVSTEATDKKIEKRRKKNAEYTVPSVYKNLYCSSVGTYENFEVCYFGEETERKIIYLHGGSFMWQPTVLHFAYCKLLAKETSLQVIMPIYPKAPEYDYADVMEWLYGFVSTLSGADTYIGDSAGGGLILSFSQYLYDRGAKLPEKAIAISPLLDASLSNEKITEYEALDPMLNRADLARKLACYVSDGDLTNPYVSPIYCDYSVMGEITVITGTHDILYPDCELLHEKLLSSGIEHNYYKFENQNHVFPIYPMPERTVCLEIVKKIINGRNG